MARIQSLNILTQDGEGKEYLAELYGKVIEGVQKALVSNGIKNQDLSGNPVSGTVEAKRFCNAAVKAYGTARTAGAGDAVKANSVTVSLNQDKEIVEELEEKDVTLYGVEGVVQRVAQRQIQQMATHLDTAFFAAAGTAATEVELDLATANVEDICEAVIQECESVQNSYVDGVPRDQIVMVMTPKWYGKLRNQLDKCERSNVDTSVEEFYSWHGVEVKSCIHLPEDDDENVIPFIVMARGAVAQPVLPKQYTAEKVNLSNAIAVELFFSYGTAAVTPDLIFVPVQEEDDTEGGGGTGGQQPET